MRHGGLLIGATTFAIALLARAPDAGTQIPWRVDAASICETRHSYRFYQRYSSTLDVDVAGPNDSIEINDAVFNPATGKAQAQSVWKRFDGTIVKKQNVAGTCAADPWLFSKATSKCSGLTTSVTCPSGSCPGADLTPKIRVPPGVVAAKPLTSSQLPAPTIASPTANQAAMVLEVPIAVTAALPPSNPFCSIVDVKAVSAQHPNRIVSASLPVAAGSAKKTLSFTQQPFGAWTLTAKIRQYTGKTAQWNDGPSASLNFYVGPAFPGTGQKPVSATMIQIVTPAVGASLPAKGGSLVVRVHRDLLTAASLKQASLHWKYSASGGGLPGEPWLGLTPLPNSIALPILPLRGDPEWRQYSVPVDFGSAAVHKQWTVSVCVHAYDTDLCQQRAFALIGP